MVSYEETTAVALARDVYREDNRPPLPEGVTLYLERRFTELCQPNQSSIFNLPSK